MLGLRDHVTLVDCSPVNSDNLPISVFKIEIWWELKMAAEIGVDMKLNSIISGMYTNLLSGKNICSSNNLTLIMK